MVVTYVAPTWEDVAPGTTPPPGAPALDAAHMQDLSDAVEALALLSGTASGVSSVNSRTGVVSLDKADVNLGNANNTADVDKPVSTAQAAAIAAVVSSAAASAIAATANKQDLLAPTAVKTAAYTAAPDDLVRVDTSAGGVTVTLPSAPADGTRVAVKHVVRGGSNVVTVAAGGSDVFNVSGGSTTVTVTLLNQLAAFQYLAAGAIWLVVGADLALSQLDTRYVKMPTGLVDGSMLRYDAASSAFVVLPNDRLLPSGQSNMDALDASAAIGATSGLIRMGYFTAVRNETINNMRAYVVAAQSGTAPTLAKMGIYSVDSATGNLTLLAATANDTTMFGAVGAVTKALGSAVSLVLGQRYALAEICVSTGTVGTLAGIGVSVAAQTAEGTRRANSLSAQTDLPSTISAGSMTDTANVPRLVALP